MSEEEAPNFIEIWRLKCQIWWNRMLVLAICTSLCKKSFWDIFWCISTGIKLIIFQSGYSFTTTSCTWPFVTPRPWSYPLCFSWGTPSWSWKKADDIEIMASCFWWENHGKPGPVVMWNQDCGRGKPYSCVESMACRVGSAPWRTCRTAIRWREKLEEVLGRLREKLGIRKSEIRCHKKLPQQTRQNWKTRLWSFLLAVRLFLLCSSSGYEYSSARHSTRRLYALGVASSWPRL